MISAPASSGSPRRLRALFSLGVAASALLCASLPSGCASYRYLPLPAASEGSSSAPLHYEKTRMLFFHANGDDGLIERPYLGPQGSPLIATVLWPAPGVLASSDNGASWSFTPQRLDDTMAPRVLRELLFDPADASRAYARTFHGLLVTSDGGRSWKHLPAGRHPERAIDALALGPDGTLYVAQGEQLFASEDHGETLHALPLELPRPAGPIAEDSRPEPVRIRSVLVDPAQAKTIYVSVEPEPPPEDFPRRLIGLLDQTTEEGKQARALLKLPIESKLDKLSSTDARAGVYVTRDGGRSWQKSGLGIDVWLAERDGSIFAIAANPLVLAAGLARRSPDLATAMGAQLHGSAFDPDALRRACIFPGREALLDAAPAAPIFRSSDQGASWVRAGDLDAPLAIALRRSVEQQKLSRDPWPPRPIKRGPEQHDLYTGIGPDEAGGAGQGGGRNAIGNPNAPPQHRFRNKTRKEREDEEAVPPDLTEPMLSLLEPAALLSHVGPDLPLIGVAASGRAAGSSAPETLWAYAPTQSFWEQLADTVVRATRKQGELSLGTASAPPAQGAGFELLRSDDAGRSWTTVSLTLDKDLVAARGVEPYPSAVAASPGQGLFVLSGHEASGDPWRLLLRER